MASAGTKLAGVIGWPVKHSLSPRLHNYWLSQMQIDGRYDALEVRPEDLERILKGLPGKGFRGVNLTLPHKENVLPMLAHADEAAKRIGAVNTIIVGSNGALHGTNTDAYGFWENIRPHLGEPRNKAVVLGAGGAARAVCHALAAAGFARIVIANRTQAKAESLAAQLEHGQAAPWEERPQILKDADLLVNTTSLGLAGHEPLMMDLSALPKSALVTDIVYNPLVTPLLAQAQEEGYRTVDGLGMLIHQAVPGFEAWFGARPEVTTELRRHLLGGLR